jgi:tryptophan synthase alpha chain
MYDHDLAPILIFSPATSPERMGCIASFARGFIYCIARKGVTGENTDFSKAVATFLAGCRQITPLPLALGFGVREKAHIDFLKGKADIAVIGSQSIRVMEQNGITYVGDFIRNLGLAQK